MWTNRWLVQNQENWSRGEQVLTRPLELLFGFKTVWGMKDWSMSENVQRYKDFPHTICLCLLLLAVSNTFFFSRKKGILSRHQINKPNHILPEIRNFFYHVPCYTPPFWSTQFKRIWENIRLMLCDLCWTPVSCWKGSKGLDPTSKVLNSFAPGKCGRSLLSLGHAVTFKDVEVHQDK